MTAITWTKPSGYSFGSFPERVAVEIPLPINSVSGISYSIISGELPPGLSVSGNSIVGDPFLVATETTFAFCIRAKTVTQISDRTFLITITGANPPEFVITESVLDIGPAHQFFAIDNTYVTYKLEATELIPSLREKLVFYLTSGTLPTGLSLSKTGMISGKLAALPTTSNIIEPQSISTFNISVTDGYLTTTKQYKIYVINPLYLSADNTVLLDANHLFTADVMSLRPIQWITSSNLGIHRSNNFITIPIQTDNNSGMIFSIDDPLNLPPGMIFDSSSAVLSGEILYQTFNAKNYIFTITASRFNPLTGEILSASRTFTIELIGDVDNIITWDNIQGSGAILIAELGYENEHGLPSSTQISSIKVVNGGSGYTDTPNVVFMPTDGGFGASAYCVVSNGSIQSVEVVYPGSGYITAPNLELSQSLGSINIIQPSSLYVSAQTTNPSAILTYSLYSGNLPPGLSIVSDGEIIGKVNKSLMTEFQGTTFDNNSTTIDNLYIFSVQAINQYGANVQSFSITVDVSTSISYSNISVKPLLVYKEREKWDDFINNKTIFPSSSLYRIYDNNFGLNLDLSMLIFAGIETSTISTYMNAVMLNNKKKRLLFNGVKTSVAIDPVTNKSIYEIVYIEMQDPAELNGAHLPLELNYNNKTYYPNNVTNWQIRISSATNSADEILSNEQSLLPLWMKTTTKTSNPGFILGLPLCYCKVGMATEIVLNINNYINNTSNNFNFNNIDYTIDRYIIDSVSDLSGPQNIIFNNNRTTV